MKVKKLLDFKNSFFFNEFIKSYIPLFLFIFILSIVSMSFAFISPLLTKALVDNVFIGKNTEIFLPIILGIIIMYIISAISSYYSNFVTGKLEFILFQNTAEKALHILQNAKISSVYNMKVGDLISRFMGNIQSAINLPVHIAPQFVISIIDIIVPLIIMLYLNLELTIIVMSPIFLYVLSSIFFGDKIESAQMEIFKKNALVYSFLNEYLSILPLIKVFNLQNWSENKFNGEMNRYYDKFISYTKLTSLNISTGSLIFGVPMILLLSFGGQMVINNSLTIGSFTAFMSYVAMFFSPISQLSQLWASYKSSLPALDRIKEIFELEKETTGNKKLIIKEGLVEFIDVWFSYDENRFILKEFNAIFKKGLNYIVGNNGTGKSTILQLLCSLYPINKGSIKIDGQEILITKTEDIRKNMSYIFSEPYIFDGTIYENILIGDLSASNEQVIEAAKLAEVHEFIENQPKQYQTLVGEKGLTLSSGEKQKISLGRAILKNSPIILLDEVTRSVDNESRKSINNVIKSLRKEKTIIIVTHNTAEIEPNSNIIYLEQNKHYDKKV